MSEMGRELDWNEEIKNDSSYTLLEEGEYDFVVTAFERSRSKGMGKLPPCNMAVVTFEVSSDQQATAIQERFVLHSSLEWKMCEFFIATGQRKHGDPFNMDFPGSIGRHGRCKVIVEPFTKKDGTEGKSNKIAKFLEPDEQTSFDTPAPTTPPAGGWKSGRF
jgi:hypothetical protein